MRSVAVAAPRPRRRGGGLAAAAHRHLQGHGRPGELAERPGLRLLPDQRRAVEPLLVHPRRGDDGAPAGDGLRHVHRPRLEADDRRRQRAHRHHRLGHRVGRRRPRRQGRGSTTGSSRTTSRTQADGSACGGTGVLAGFDCNGDGVFSVSDYARRRRTSRPPASAGHPLGDRNGNGILDAGDLILNFSDGVDDDGNGYVDDIAGWDFMKDDNDPYDDTRYGHGTGEARDSSAQTNNMIGDAGVCPYCRFMPLRAGDSFITDVTHFGKAVVYATDNGVKRGAVRARHHQQQPLRPGRARLRRQERRARRSRAWPTRTRATTTCPRSTTTRSPSTPSSTTGATLANSTTFLAFNTCSNYGGQNFLSASGTRLLERGHGQALRHRGPRLLGGAQVQREPAAHARGGARPSSSARPTTSTSPRREMPDSPYFWSQPGFAQRFGYGRVNANAAVEAVRDGKIPPEVDIVSPTWFTVLYQDQVDGADRHRRHRLGQARDLVRLRGRVGARRAAARRRVQARGAGGHQRALEHGHRRQPERAAGEARHHQHRPDAPAGHRQPQRRERHRHHRARAGDGPLRRRGRRREGRAAAHLLRAEGPDAGEGLPHLRGRQRREQPQARRHRRRRRARHRVRHRRRRAPRLQDRRASGPAELPGFPVHSYPEDGLLSPAPTPSTPVVPRGARRTPGGGVDPNLGARALRRRRRPSATSTATASPRSCCRRGRARSTCSAPTARSSPAGPCACRSCPRAPSTSTKTPTQPCMDARPRASRAARSRRRCSSTSKNDGTLEDRAGRVRRQRLRLQRRRHARRRLARGRPLHRHPQPAARHQPHPDDAGGRRLQRRRHPRPARRLQRAARRAAAGRARFT